mgnify:FL=1|jgi:hypothetical protein
MPMVMNAHTTAAKTEAIWVREERVMLYSFQVGRIGPFHSPDHSGYA